MLRTILQLLVLVVGFSAPASAESAGPPGHLLGDNVVNARLELDSASVRPGDSTDATLELTPAAGWHLYGPERGDAGAPPDIAWTLPASLRAGSIVFPPSMRVVTYGLTTYEYRGPVDLRVRWSASSMAKPQRGLPVRADVTWLVCSHVCAPGRTTLSAVIDIDPTAAAASASFAPFILLAFLGGLILNLMPCVFPVLSFKALRAIGDPVERRWRNAIAYTFGVIASCASLGAALIAARAAGHAIGWGFQLQSPPFVAFLAVLLSVLGLGMSGVFELTIPVPTGLSRRALGLGAFGDGVLVTLIASACIAPYMGAALGFALSASPAAALGIFVALGFGIALPHATLMVIPALLGWIPRPGQWMVTARRILALPLYASAAWLIWVFAQQIIPQPTATTFVASATPAFSNANLAALRRAHRAVLVEVGAVWCITCQVNERFALERPEVTRRLAALDVTVVHADWTSQNPQITAYLHSLGSAGVPLYAYYRTDGTIEIWPQLLTSTAIIDRLNRV
ncbi:MAG: thioredoxin family protein [Vulcanimicrobiaceae bacterium]